MIRRIKSLPLLFLCLLLLFGAVQAEESADAYVLTNVGSTVKVAHDKGFSREQVLDVNDLHYGWSLGDFFLRGFSDVSAPEGGMPVFRLKENEPLSLGFTLRQDLNALNGNTQYVISEDTNGYDDVFKIPRQNFGKGCLIIQKTDDLGQVSTQAYPDYLTAAAAASPDAVIPLSGAGEYAVSLDYEIRHPGALGAARYNDYKIFFRFAVLSDGAYNTAYASAATAAASVSPDQVNRWIIIGASVLFLLVAVTVFFLVRRHYAEVSAAPGEGHPAVADAPVQARRFSFVGVISFLTRNKKAGILVLALLVCIVLCFTVLRPWLSSPATYAEPVKYLNDKLVKATLLSAGTTSASVLITMMPDDIGTPVANELAQVSGYMMLVLSAIMLEKILVTSLGYLSAAFLFPLAFFLGIVAILLRGEFRRKITAHAIRLFIFAVCVVLIIPVGCRLGSLIENINADTISISLADAEDANSKVENELPKEQSDLNVFQKAVRSIWNGLQEMLSWMKNQITHYMTTVAILLVTTVAVPILILLAFVWAIHLVTGKDYINAFVSFTKRFSGHPGRGHLPARSGAASETAPETEENHSEE